MECMSLSSKTSMDSGSPSVSPSKVAKLSLRQNVDMPEIQHDDNELLAYLVRRAAKFREHARRNDAAATSCYLIAIGGSLAATLCTAFVDLPRWIVASITAVPGVALLANSVFAFDKKCRWHRKRKLKYDAFAMRIRYEGAGAAMISKELREFEERVDVHYPRFGTEGEGKKEYI